MSKFTLNLSVDSNVVNLCFIPDSLLEMPKLDVPKYIKAGDYVRTKRGKICNLVD